MGTHPIFESDFDCLTVIDGMNADDIFRKLSRGVSFDRRKFKEDAENLGIIEKKDEPECEVNAKDSIFITPMNQSEESTNENLDFIIEEFEEKVDKRILSNLENVMKWEKPTRIQMAAIDILLKGNNIVATAQTGSGKTGAFMIPLVQKCLLSGRQKVFPTHGIVLAPSRELAEQIGSVGRAISKGTHVTVADTSQSEKTILSASIICGTPNKIIALLNDKKLNLSKVKILILDECDKMVEIGNKLNHEDVKFFIAQVGIIKAACSSNLQMCLFSATMSGAVEKFGQKHFKNGFTCSIGKEGNSVSKNVHQKVIYCGDERGKLMALRQFIKEGFRPPAILFTETKERCQRIMGELLYDGINAMSLCAAKSPAERQKVIQATRLGKVWLLITTDVASRGLDLPSTSTVINYDCPASVTDYVHRVGRCGRYNRKGKALTLMTDKDQDRIRILRGVMTQAGADLPKAVLNLAKPDSRKQKRKIQKSKIEREELQTKLPKRDLKATETKRRRKMMSDKKKKEMAKKRKILNEQNGENGNDDGWEIADGN